jgi:hypothetical protein
MVADALPAVSSVLNTLVNVEYVFENALQYSHVEDVHMDKRLFIPSAEVMAANPYTTTLLDNQHLVSRYQDHLRQQLRTLQAELRDTHEYGSCGTGAIGARGGNSTAILTTRLVVQEPQKPST